MSTTNNYRQVLISGLIFLLLIGQTVVSGSLMDIEFSDEKEKIIGHSRILFGYNTSLIENSDLNIVCWVILVDQGDYDIVWEGILVNYVIKSLDEQKEDKSELILVENSRSNKLISITTGYNDLIEKDLQLKIIFYFHERYDDESTVTSSFTKNWTKDLANAIKTCVIIGIGAIVIIFLIRKANRGW